MNDNLNDTFQDKIPDDEIPGATDEAPTAPQRVILLAVDTGEVDRERSMAELWALAQSNDMQPVAQLLQKREHPEGATYLGEGRVAEAAELCRTLQATACIVDDELTGIQLRNLEKTLEVPVLDRTMLILEIFSNRAVTSEGKLQTELARLRYRLPRLVGLGEELSRQGGGGSGGRGARRGAGESKLEYDRRHLRRRIALLQDKLTEMEKRRAETRRSRQKSGVPVVALVGYTNVGKSSLLNRICGAEVGVQDMLFATLDPTARRATLPSGLDVVFVDTVGFVSRLPHHLVEAFKSTLEEAAFADLILKVCDVADETAAPQLEVTDQVLDSLGCADIPQLLVYNKCDLAPDALLFDGGAVRVSATTGQGIPQLLEKVDALLADRVRQIEVLLPYDQLSLAALLRTSGAVLEESYRPDGLFCRATVRREDLHRFLPYLV